MADHFSYRQTSSGSKTSMYHCAIGSHSTELSAKPPKDTLIFVFTFCLALFYVCRLLVVLPFHHVILIVLSGRCNNESNICILRMPDTTQSNSNNKCERGTS